MQNEQTKSLLVNIITGVVVIGVLTAGYFVFTGQSQVPAVTSAITSVGQVASETASIGNEIESTVRDLEDLQNAVASSAILFSTPAFQNLQDFTAAVPFESIGRTNPFLVTNWKQKMIALEKTATAGLSVAPKAVATQTSIAGTSSSSSSLMSDFTSSPAQGI